MASANDFFMKVGRSTATTLASPGYTTGDTSINVASTTNWPADTGVTFAIDEVDSNGLRVSGTYNVFRGKVAGGTQIDEVTYVGGDTNRNYSAGATTRVYILVSSYRDNRFTDGVLVSHEQDGTLKAGAVDNAAVLANDVVETAKIKDLNVTTAKYADASVTPDKLATGAQQALVATSQTTTSTSFTDLATTTDTVTATIGANGLALIIISAKINNTDSAAGGFVGVAISGANTVAASEANSLNLRNSTGAPDSQTSWTYLHTGLTPGSTTFKLKYRVTAGTGTFTNRRIMVIPL